VNDVASRKKKDDAKANGGGSEAWKAAADAANKAAAVQTRLDLGDEQVAFEQLEFEVALSATEAALKDHEASCKLAEAGRRQTALDRLIDTQITPEKAAIKDLQKSAAGLARESQEMKHKVIRRTEVVYRPNTLSVHFFEPGSDRKIVVMQERRMTDAEVTRFEGGQAAADDLPVVEAPPDSGPVNSRGERLSDDHGGDA
jgi:hypothetical protein